MSYTPVPPRPRRKYMSRIYNGRYSKNLPRNLADKLADYAEVVDDTTEEEAVVRWLLGEYMEGFSKGDVSRDQLYTNFLAGMESIRRAIESRMEAKYKKGRLIDPEQVVIVLRLIGDAIDKRISDSKERTLLAQDIAAITRNQRAILSDPHYGHPQLPPSTALAIIDDAIPR